MQTVCILLKIAVMAEVSPGGSPLSMAASQQVEETHSLGVYIGIEGKLLKY